MSTTYIMGIDPGLTGAIVIVDAREGNIFTVYDMPSIPNPAGKGNIVSPQLLANFFQDILQQLTDLKAEVKVVIEKVSSMPGQGVASMFKFGRCVGVIEGVVAAFWLPVEYVTPQKWKKFHGLLKKDKDTARQLCLQKYPTDASFQLKKHCGRADATLIALWGLEQYS